MKSLARHRLHLIALTLARGCLRGLICSSVILLPLASFCGPSTEKEKEHTKSSEEGPPLSKESPSTSQQAAPKDSQAKEKPPIPIVYQVTIQGPITPSATESLTAAIEKAEQKQADALLVSMDTPGGLVSSMDDMVRRILSARVPVLTYISPPGAACGSAGVFIMYASHISAMAPATNIGSATPVSLGGGGGAEPKKDDRIPKTAGADDRLNLKRKLLNHTLAQVRSLAQYHGRNAIFAERTITQAINFTSQEAYKVKAIDILAANETELLRKADGRQVRMSSGRVVLNLKGAKIINIKRDFRQRILDLIANPNFAYILMMLGMLGILAEIQSPGLIFPGVVGAISLVLGLYAMQTLPLNYAGLGLIGLALVLFVLEFYILSYGLLSLAAIFSLVLGSLMLVRSGSQFTNFSLGLVVSVSIGTGILAALIVYLAARSQRAAQASGYPKLIRESGVSRTQIDAKSGSVLLHSEIWQARSPGVPVPAQAPVRVVNRKGLTLIIEEIKT